MGDAAEQQQIRRRVVDPNGRLVILTEQAWGHVLAGHPELARFEQEVVDTITHPADCTADVRPERERFLSENVGPSRYLTVVVEFADREGTVITAFPHRNLR